MFRKKIQTTTLSKPSRLLLPTLLVALLALPFLSPTALAQPPAAPGDGPGGPGFGPRGAHGAHGGGLFGNLGFLVRFLDLTEEQQAQVQALRENLRQNSALLREESRALRQDLRTALDAEAPDATEVGELAIALHGQRQELRQLRDQAIADFEALLTQEQLESFQQLKESIQDRRENRRERRGRRGGP